MPRYFLQDFKLVAHPETKAPWWTPGDLDAQPGHSTAAALEETPAALDGTDTALADTETTTPPPEHPRHRPQPKSRVGYMVARGDLVEAVSPSGPKSKLNGKHLTMITSHPSLVRKGVIPKIVWRADMHTYLLEEMRSRIVNDLLYLARLRTDSGRTHLVPCASWASVSRDMPQRGCVLWQSGAAGVPPGPLATLDVEGASYERAMPVHNLDILLGDEQLARLREEDLFRDNALVVARKRLSLDVQLRLWKLQGYLAPPAR